MHWYHSFIARAGRWNQLPYQAHSPHIHAIHGSISDSIMQSHQSIIARVGRCLVFLTGFWEKKLRSTSGIAPTSETPLVRPQPIVVEHTWGRPEVFSHNPVQQTSHSFLTRNTPVIIYQFAVSFTTHWFIISLIQVKLPSSSHSSLPCSNTVHW